MPPPFHNIRIGPFATQYHRSSVDATFCADLYDHLCHALLPQVTIAYEEVGGSLVAVFDEDRFCGPNSVVKNIYRLVMVFRCGDTTEEVDAELKYVPSTRSFVRHKGKALYLWTVGRKARVSEVEQRIEEVCRAIERGERLAGPCPVCGAELRIADNDRLFDVTCPSHCFSYNYHRHPETRGFVHGHLFMKEPA
jgi:hypothetical protein